MENPLNKVIMDAVDGAAFDEETPETETVEETQETAATDDAAAEVTDETTQETEESTEQQSTAVASPAAGTAKKAEKEKPAVAEDDDPLKQYGIPSKSVTGRDNPIPYSRVRKIVDKAVKDTTTKITKTLEEKYNPQVQEFTTKIKDYEERLGRVAQFEHNLVNEPKSHLQMLAKIPAYKPFFEAVMKAISPAQPAQETQQSLAASAPADDPMPQPNQKLSDGSSFYNMEGLQQLMDWQARQVERRITAQMEGKVTARLEPFEKERQRQQYISEIIPVIEKQIAEARTWPLFKENEAAIEEALRKDRTLTLEAAYRQIVLPRMAADKNRMRTELLEEIRKKPATTAAPAARTAPRRPSAAQPKSTHDAIIASLEEAGIPFSLDKD